MKFIADRTEGPYNGDLVELAGTHWRRDKLGKLRPMTMLADLVEHATGLEFLSHQIDRELIMVTLASRSLSLVRQSSQAGNETR